MRNWRENNYCRAVGCVFFAEGVLMLISLLLYDMWGVWQAQFATWLFFVAGIAVLVEDFLYKKQLLNQDVSRLGDIKDKFYDKLIAGLYALQWAILLLGDFQSDIGEYLLIDIVTWGSISMAIIVIFDDMEFWENK